jgi:PIN domain nuclease of toxin-antitoxin system
VNILLDTHTLLWAIGQSKELSKKVIKEIENTDNEIFVSAVSLWEIALKTSIGKLKLSFPVANIADYCKRMEFTLLPLEPLDALNSKDLPLKAGHRDPFDRLLVYTSIKYGYALASKDNSMKFYKDNGLVVLW